jgi:hypothetical protein
MEIKFNKNINKMVYKQGNKGNWKELTPERAMGMSEKEAVEMLDYYTAKHNTWSIDKMPPRDVYDKISLPEYNAPQFLSFLTMVGDAGIYWAHDWEKKSFTMAFECISSKLVSMRGFMEEIKRRKDEVTYNIKGDTTFDLKSFLAKK